MADVRRQSNFEWLRILAMGMIITLHYFFKGGIIFVPLSEFDALKIVSWFICSFCVCAVNTYVLISGYFLTDSEFRFSRLVNLMLQVLEYSLIILAVLLATGVLKLSDMDPYTCLGYVFPVGTEEYWFVTSYFLMYLISPVLAGGARSMNKKTFKIVLGGLIFFECMEKSVIPAFLPGDKYGYDLIWFITLFLLAAYIRIHGIPVLEKKGIALTVYAASSLLIWAVGLIGSYLGFPVALHYADITSHYNYIFVLTASVGLFYMFKNAHMDESGVPARIARMLGRLTFGVYLLHEHPGVRDRWQGWLGAHADGSLAGTLAGWLVSLTVVYGAGLIVEYVRTVIHGYFGRRASLK